MGMESGAIGGVGGSDLSGVPPVKPKLIDVRHNGSYGGYFQRPNAEGWSTFGVATGKSEGGFQNRAAIRSEASFANYGFSGSDNRTQMFNATYSLKPGTSGVIAQIMNLTGGKFVPPMKLIVNSSGQLTVDQRGGDRTVIPNFNAMSGPFELTMISDGKTFAIALNGQVVFTDEINTPGGYNFFKMGLYTKGAGGEVSIRDAKIIDVTDVDNLQLPTQISGGGGGITGGGEGSLQPGYMLVDNWVAGGVLLATLDDLWDGWNESELDEEDDYSSDLDEEGDF